MAGKQGRPAWDLTDEKREKAISWASAGCTNKQIAAGIGCHVSTFQDLLNRFPDFGEALKAARETADAMVQNALWTEAINGNTTAQIFWMKARAGWRDNNADEIRKAELELKREAMAKGLPDPDQQQAMIVVPADSVDWQKMAERAE